MPLPFIIAGLAAGGALVGEALDAENARKQKDQRLEALKSLLIPSYQTERRADMAGDTLYTKAMRDINQGAFAGRGTLNPEVLRSIAHSQMAGARAETEGSLAEEDYQFNRNLQSQIVETTATVTPKINPVNVVGAGVEGYFAGKQLQSSMELNKNIGDYYGKLAEGTPQVKPSKTNFAGLLDLAKGVTQAVIPPDKSRINSDPSTAISDYEIPEARGMERMPNYGFQKTAYGFTDENELIKKRKARLSAWEGK